MGKSKHDLGRLKANLKVRLLELEEKARLDPLKKNAALHEELEKVRAQLKKAE